MSTYFATLTTAGAAKLANALALGTTVKFTHMAVGDGNGAAVTPNPAMTALVKERRRAAINTLFVDPLSASQMVAEQVIPEDVGDWWIREIGLFDDAGTLMAVANCPDTYKPLLTSGAGRTQVIRMVFIVSDTAAVELKIDPSVVLATRKWVEEQIDAHVKSRNHPDASESAKGFVQLATAAQAAPTTEAEASSTAVATIARVFGVLRSAIAAATETLRGTVRIGTQAEIDAATSDSVVPSAKKLGSHYRRGNILGAVSLSSGVPAGAIIESGYNANGRYIKYANGTMFCDTGITLSALTANTVKTQKWNYPAAFKVDGPSGIPRAFVTPDSADSLVVTASVYDLANVTGPTVVGARKDSATGLAIHAMATGMWG